MLKGGGRVKGLQPKYDDTERFPVVTVALVALNAENEIRGTLESILSQRYPNLEVLVIDGASKDGTVGIIREYEDRLDYYESEPDQGIYHAMNKAGALARGTYLNFMNAGDSFVDETAIESVFSRIVGSPDLVYGDTVVHDGDSRKIVKASGPLEEAVYERMPICHQSLFTKTQIFRTVPFNTEYRIVADYDFVLRCLRSGRSFFHVDTVVANYVLGGFTRQNIERAAHEFIKSMYDNGFDDAKIRESSFLKGIVRRSSLGKRKDDLIKKQADVINNKNALIAQLKKNMEGLPSSPKGSPEIRRFSFLRKILHLLGLPAR